MDPHDCGLSSLFDWLLFMQPYLWPNSICVCDLKSSGLPITLLFALWFFAPGFQPHPDWKCALLGPHGQTQAKADHVCSQFVFVSPSAHSSIRLANVAFVAVYELDFLWYVFHSCFSYSFRFEMILWPIRIPWGQINLLITPDPFSLYARVNF